MKTESVKTGIRPEQYIPGLYVKLFGFHCHTTNTVRGDNNMSGLLMLCMATVPYPRNSGTAVKRGTRISLLVVGASV